jgi:threonine/homoserine/homoserine lactone efflux protein
LPVSLEIWIAFALASAVLLAIPGPTVMLVVSYALGRGRESAWATVPGVTLGDFTAMTVSLAGAGAVLAASATLFLVLKLCGAAYLVWLGIGLWRAVPARLAFARGAQAPGERSRMFWRTFWNAYVVTALNPKSIVFFIAFVPQFVVADAPLMPQFSILIVTFVGLAAVNTVLWAVLVGEMRRRFERPGTLKLINRIGGSFLIGAGMLTALVRRTA